MRTTMDDLVRLLDERFDGRVRPTDDLVLRQRFEYLTSHWSRRWPAHQPSDIPALDGGRLSVSRAELFTEANSVVTELDAINFYVRVCAWGTGTGARGVARSVRALDAADAGKKLLTSFGLAREGQAIEAYRRLNTKHDLKIPYFGPAFFTKWLYFAGYECEAAIVDGGRFRPLILDARVAQSLGWRQTGWSSSEYLNYLKVARALQERWCPRESVHVIEYALFDRSPNGDPLSRG
jgi:hypothetical protein